MSNVIVIGGGPAGMICAGKAAAEGNNVILIEKNEKLGKKLFITGKGRCNFTSNCEVEEIFDNVVHNKKFLYSSIYNFTNKDTIEFFNKLGLKEKVERGGRVFPESDKSSDVIKALDKYVKQNGVKVMLKTEVASIFYEEGRVNGVELKDGTRLAAEKVVVATGGLTYSQTGSTGDGYKFAEEAGHRINEIEGALIPLETKESFVKDLQGLSLKNVSVSLYEGKKLKETTFGEMIFTHFGVSGPMILSLSSRMKKNKKYSIKIDLKAALDNDTLDRRIVRDFEKNSNKILKNSMDDLLPQRLIPIIIRLSGIKEDKIVNQISKEERLKLVQTLKGMELEITSKAHLDLGIITAGGVDTKEINPQTMESKKVPGLYFAGEVIDVDALTGGFNLQIAFSTGYLAGTDFK
ncbi:MAG: NAD(P)/FAD-dependent oxidoreductase [Eubacteriaceae bacterium]|nr:NAD(P)/FAD-dependent oxidoreductase [Eubacteriaceae bacterium]